MSVGLMKIVLSIKEVERMVLNTIQVIALLVMIKPAKSFSLMVRSSLTSSPVLVGYAMI